MASSLQTARQLIEQGRRQEAYTLLREELQQDPNNAAAWRLLSSAAQDKPTAIRALERALQLDPDDEWSQRRLHDLTTTYPPNPDDRPPAQPTADPAVAMRLERLDADMEDLSRNVVEVTRAVQDLRTYEENQDRRSQRGLSLLPVLVFVGTLLGSVLGLTADLGETLSNVQEFQSFTYPVLHVQGSSTVLEEGLGMSAEWREGFEELEQVRVRYNAVGSVTGAENAAAGENVHVLAMSEPMTPDVEQMLSDSGVEIQCAAEIGYDIIVFVTDGNNTVSGTTIPRLRTVLTGAETTWTELGGLIGQPVTIFYRPGSGTTDYVLREIAGYTGVGGSEVPPEANYVPCASNEECLNRTLATPGALYWMSVSWIFENQVEEAVTLLPILDRSDTFVTDPLAVDESGNSTFRVRDYPPELVRPLYMYVVDNGTGTEAQLELAEAYLRYVRGLRGQNILEGYNFFRHFDRPLDVVPPLPTGFTFTAEDGGPRSICTTPAERAQNPALEE